MSVLAAVAVPHPPIILPQIGRGEERKIQSTTDAYRKAMQFVCRFNPDTVVIISPHSIIYGDYFHISPGSHATGSFATFGCPDVTVSCDYDTEFVDTLEKQCKQDSIYAGTLGEKDPALDHGTMIPLHFLSEFSTSVNVVRIGLSGLDFLTHYRLGQAIQKTADKLKRRVVVIASGDLSHKLLSTGPYGYAKQGPEFDEQIMTAFKEADFFSILTMDPQFCDAAAECGHRAFIIMAGALDRRNISASVLSYEGPFGVGYGVATFEVVTGNEQSRDIGEQFLKYENTRMQEKQKNEDEFVRLARFSLEHFVRTGEEASLPENLSPSLTGKQAGAFVSLKKNGRLRGCIGTILPCRASLAEEILHNAVSACAHDPRVNPVTEDELPYLVYSVDVLTEPQHIESESELNPKKYGVIVKNGGRQGVLLPDLEGIDTVQQQISIAKQKARIMPDEEVELYRFEVIRHH
ncbi:MAG: AmmeMemoRadiSam system protein A [Succinivibrio sp.]|nr:AmmeMemoRadiSam system protein A [Succinivibrio sp.]